MYNVRVLVYSTYLNNQVPFSQEAVTYPTKFGDFPLHDLASRTSVLSHVSDFLAGSTAHGVKYLTLLWAPFLLWTVAVGSGFLFAWLYISDLLGESSVIVENGDISIGLNDVQVK